MDSATRDMAPPDTLILLCPPYLALAVGAILAAASQIGPAIITAHDLAGLSVALDGLSGQRVRLLAICFGTLVPAALLARCTGGAINLHPAPPEYPGSGGLHLALYDGAATFGATAHLMRVRVDAGAILDVERFAIPPGIGNRTLSDLTLAAVLRLLQRLAPALLDRLPAPAGPGWGGKPRRMADVLALARLTADMPAGEVQRRWQAFRDGPDSPLHIDLNGMILRYQPAGRIQGWFDGIRDGHAHGWAYDPAGGPVRLRLVVNDGAGLEAVASLPRPDVAAAGHGDGQCGFAIPLTGLLPARGPIRIDLLLPHDEWRRLPGTPVFYANPA